MDKKWKITDPPPQEVLGRFPELHPMTVRLLWNRGICTQQDIDEFLYPDYGKDIHDPFLFNEMEAACRRVWEALRRRERIMIHGDYDADGVTGAALLSSVFRDVARLLGGDPDLIGTYLPHREKEGYGLRRESVESFVGQGIRLLVTVDCGISCAEEIALGKENGLDTIVVDHHQVPEQVPDCLIIHPLVPGESYPFKHLAAAGVAFKFASGFLRFATERGADIGKGAEKWLLDLVAIATVTDFMPLLGENRTLEKYGLIVLNKTRRHGLREIVRAAGLELGRLDTTSVGFYIGPRINAASRMDHADLALHTLMAETAEEAAALAERLDRCNVERQRYTETILNEARVLAEGLGRRKVYVIVGDGWSAGVAGLVAGKLVTELGAPVFILGRDGDRMVGSGRSIPQFDIMAALERAKDNLVRFGGHPQACGLTIDGADDLAAFISAVERFADEVLDDRDLVPTLEVDGRLRAGEVTWELIEELERFAPYGEGNPRPRFLMEGLTVGGLRQVGRNGSHLKLTVRGDSSRELNMIAFGLAGQSERLVPGTVIDAIVEPGVNTWNGTKSIQLKVIDLRPSVTARAAGLKELQKASEA
ncbi:hypothetical protein AMJ57_05375 [Parcubacteria bacterium SG8_24]|nr:MAG: hypothetical protein AMJ57_05375 [Parcubacteria bacterium SG8_24]